MTEHVILFEDETVVNFQPLSFTSSVMDLRCGAFTLREKWEHYFTGAAFFHHTRSFIRKLVDEQFPEHVIAAPFPDSLLLINGRIIASEASVEIIRAIHEKEKISENGIVLACRLSGEDILDFVSGTRFLSEITGAYKEIDSTLNIVSYPWDLFNNNGKEIKKDFDRFYRNHAGKFDPHKYPGVYFLNNENIYLGENVVIKPGVVIDAEDGPVVIEDNVKIFPQAVLEGPVFIGKWSTVKIGAKIYGSTSIGPVCKVGGEIEGSILHSYSNKQHEGFLGHAYIGKWCNLGADTNNSDLKNTYEHIKVKLNGILLDTGLQFVGLIMGDHSKTAINTMFNTGTICGVCSNVFGAGFPPVYIPSFTWGGNEIKKAYLFDKAMEVNKKVMKRRNRELTENEENVLRYVFELTQPERIKYT